MSSGDASGVWFLGWNCLRSYTRADGLLAISQGGCSRARTRKHLPWNISIKSPTACSQRVAPSPQSIRTFKAAKNAEQEEKDAQEREVQEKLAAEACVWLMQMPL